MESGEHVQEFKVKWSRTKKFLPSHLRSRSQYIGHPLNPSCAVFLRFAVPENVCVLGERGIFIFLDALKFQKSAKV